jgi:glycosyltransferase involved in cell wall biosynthesis
MIGVLQIVHKYRGNYELLNLQASLDPARFRTIVCFLSGDPDGNNRLETIAHKVIYLRSRTGSLRWYNLPLILRLKRIIDQEQVQVVNCQQHRSTPLGVMAGLLAKSKPVIVSTLHGLGTARTWQRKLLNWLLYRRLFRIVGISEGVSRDILADNWGLQPEKVTTIQNGLKYEPFLVDLEREAAKAEILPGMQDRFWFGTAGRLSEVKNYQTLIEAFSEAAAALPDSILVIAGQGELEATLKDATRTLGLEGRVFFLGFRRDIPRLLQALDVFLLPSLREGLPLALLEAMAAARPAIASRVGGIPEVVGDSGCAILVDPRDREQLAQALEQMRRISPEERAAMGARARERAVTKVSAERMIRNYEELYAAAFSRHQGQTGVDGRR